MSRVSILEQLYCKRKSALEFKYDNLWAPPIKSLLTQEDINKLIYIAKSVKYNGDINKKYKMIDEVMIPRGFRKAHAGTNRVVYNYLEDPTFVAKIAIDRVGMEDTPKEYVNQEYFKPFCCKIFEVDPSGVIGFVERVNPITSLEEFLSVSDDIFNLIITKIIGKYVVDDIGVHTPFNYGIRISAQGYTFGPVLLDFPYAFELDGKKLICNKFIETAMGNIPCGGDIDYDLGFDKLVCCKCGRKYQARDLANNNPNIKLIINEEGSTGNMSRARIVCNGKVILDSEAATRTYITKEQFEQFNSSLNTPGDMIVTKTIRTKSKSRKQKLQDYYTKLMIDKFANDTATEAKIITVKDIIPQKTDNIQVVTAEVRSDDELNKLLSDNTIKEDNDKSNKKKEKCPNKSKVKCKEDDKEMDTECDDDIVVEPEVGEAIDTVLDNVFKKLDENAESDVEEVVDTYTDEHEVETDSIEENVEEDTEDDTCVKEENIQQLKLEFEEFKGTEELEQDYSNYEYDENSKDPNVSYEHDDYEDGEDYSMYIKKTKADRRSSKKKGKRYYPSDMDEY